MKKISTVATRQAKNFPPQKLTVGLDLGDRWSWYCVLDEAGKIRLEQRVSTTSKAMGEVFGAHAAQSDRTGNRDAFALDQSLAQRVGA